MPELPEVETVRRDLARGVVGRRIRTVEVHHPRAVRRHGPGADHFVAAVSGQVVEDVRRRGKYLWLPLAGGDAIVAHLGMSGQLLLREPGTAPEKHLRVRFVFDDEGPELRFVDQRTFGGMALAPEGAQLPAQIAHIARDPMDPEFSDRDFVAALRRRHSAVKRALLDQSLVSGVGNIYADEALWRTGLHGNRMADTLTAQQAASLIGQVRQVLREALESRGTSFDALYVDVNGQSGRYGNRLAVYGRVGAPCPRCGTAIIREPFMNRSSFSCPSCQPVA